MAAVLAPVRRAFAANAPEPEPDLLLIEDDADTRLALELRLGASGYTVRSVGSVREATAQLARHVPSLVVADLGLPDSSGPDIVHRLKAAASCPELGILVLSAHTTREVIQDVLRSGAALYLCKPVEGDELLEAIDYLLEVPRMENCRRCRSSAHARARCDAARPELRHR